ncbi:MAG: hypothetical protein NZ581_06190 [Candidatus Caldarchaeum sp.]|nr:hypothetical protein [Candidatus Caldarchaeum sp.]MDW8435771.1 hypothetical protein [Candidatus Caldarchaeum sp.]
MRRRSSGISAVVGTAIGLMIFFTVVIPMWIYMQNVQTLFMDEVSRRMRFEIEKVNENLEAMVSLQPPEIHMLQRSRLYLYVVNKSPIEVGVPVIYVESSKLGLTPISRVLKLAPGEKIMTPVSDYVLEPDEKVLVRLPTLRGNSFATGEIGPTNLPHLLIVQVSNASFGYWYNVKVNVVSAGDVNKVVGCVALGTHEYAAGCRGTAETWRYVSSPDDLALLAGFAVAPGLYEVRVMQCQVFGGSCSDVPPGPTTVDIRANTVVEVNAARGVMVPRPIPLKITPVLPMYTYIANATEHTVVYSVPFMVYLGNNTEPLQNIRVTIEIRNMNNITVSLVNDQFTISRLSPGESYLGMFMVKASDESENRSYGGWFIYRLALTAATGQITRRTYSATDFVTAESQGTVVHCRWWTTRNNLIVTTCRTP